MGKQDVLNEALKLTAVERAELIEDLLSSFESNSQKAIDALWAQEVEDRMDAFERGEITSKSAEAVFSDIEKKKPQ